MTVHVMSHDPYITQALLLIFHDSEIAADILSR